MDLSGNLASPTIGFGGGVSPIHTAAFQLASNGEETPFSPVVRTMASTKSCPPAIKDSDADGSPNSILNPKRMKLHDEVGNAPIAAAPTQGETVGSPGDLNESPHVEMSVPIAAVPIAAVPIAAVPIAAVPIVPVTIDDLFGHSTQGCPIWHKNNGKPLLTRIGLGPTVILQNLVDSARKPAIRTAQKAGRKETKLTCSKCALATLSHTLVMPNGSDGDERKVALRNALAAFLVAREVQG